LKADKGELDGAVLFLSSDSSMVEGAVDKGNSSSKELFKKVCRLRKSQMKHSFALYVTHCSGKWMIVQGMDGLSRGVLNKGLLATGSVKIYIPLNLTALQWSESLEAWLRSWLLPNTLFLTPAQWFVKAHNLRFEGEESPCGMKVQKGCYLWAPLPCIADVAIEQLRLARLKHQQSIHVMIIPRLFYAI